jgi:hypothetical protein
VNKFLCFLPALLWALTPVQAQTAAPSQSKPRTAKPAPKSPKAATQRQQLKAEAQGLAVGADAAEAVSENQLSIASRVLTGQARCEFSQHVNVERHADRPGTFKVAFKNTTYTMVPEETTTGAVRLFDKKAGVVWLQIPSKSMLMNSKLGQRMVDSCTQTEQRVAVKAVLGAAEEAK